MTSQRENFRKILAASGSIRPGRHGERPRKPQPRRRLKPEKKLKLADGLNAETPLTVGIAYQIMQQFKDDVLDPIVEGLTNQMDNLRQEIIDRETENKQGELLRTIKPVVCERLIEGVLNSVFASDSSYEDRWGVVIESSKQFADPAEV